MLPSICQQIWKTQQGPQDWKSSILIPIPKQDSPKECSNHWRTELISHTTKAVLKILQSRLQYCVNQELPGVQAGQKRQRNQRSNYQHSLDHRESKESIEKHLCFIDYIKAFDYRIITNCGKLFKSWEYQIILPLFWETCVWVKKHS